MSEPKKSTATLLVEIAEDLYTFGCTPGTRPPEGELVHEGYTWAAPRQAPDLQRPLADIRPDIAAMFEVRYGRAPGASALGDAMTVLEGKARQAEPTEPTRRLSALLAGGQGSTKATRLIKMAQDNFRFGVTLNGDAFAVPLGGPNIARPLRGGRRSLRAELARMSYAEQKESAGAQALADALLVLEGEAGTSDPEDVALRAGRHPQTGELVLDLGRDDGLVVVIGGWGWQLTKTSPVLFWRTNAMLPLPQPEPGGDLGELQALLNIGDKDWPLAVGYLTAALIPDIPHPALDLRGEHGTAKSTAARLLTSLIDPCASQLRTAPRNVEDWAVACAASWVTCLDNVSSVQEWLQDAICRACTGDGLLRRELYTNSDVTVLAFRRVIALTAIDPGPINGDLADRLLTIDLDTISDADRRSEQDLAATSQQAHPQVLAALLDLACDVLRTLPSIRRGSLPRMADFARVLLAVDQVLHTSGYDRYADQAARTAETVADSDPVIVAIRQRVKTAWRGSAGDLLALLAPDPTPKDWPGTPQAMGGRLSRAAPVLRKLGWSVKLTTTGTGGHAPGRLPRPSRAGPSRAGPSRARTMQAVKDVNSGPRTRH